MRKKTWAFLNLHIFWGPQIRLVPYFSRSPDQVVWLCCRSGFFSRSFSIKIRTLKNVPLFFTKKKQKRRPWAFFGLQIRSLPYFFTSLILLVPLFVGPVFIFCSSYPVGMWFGILLGIPDSVCSAFFRSLDPRFFKAGSGPLYFCRGLIWIQGIFCLNLYE